MVQIIQERRKPSFVEKLHSATGKVIDTASQLYTAHQQNQALKDMGIANPGLLSSEFKNKLLEEHAMTQQQKRRFDEFERNPQQDMGQQLQGGQQRQQQPQQFGQEQQGQPQGEGAERGFKTLPPEVMEDLRTRFIEALPQIEQMAGRELTPEDLDQLWEKAVTTQMQNLQQQRQEAEMPEEAPRGQEPQFKGAQQQEQEEEPPQKKDYYQKVRKAAVAGMPKEYIAGLKKEADAEQKRDLELEKLEREKSQKKKEEIAKFVTGLDTIERMREIIDKGNVGRGSSIMGLFPGETQRDRSELHQLGKSLIPLVAAGVPIRNQKEFEEYRKTITDPSAPISEWEGALDGLERIFKNKINPEGSKKEAKEESGTLKKVKPGTELTLESMEKIYKKVNGDKAKAKALAKKMGYEVE